METNGNGTGGQVPGAWGFRGARPPGLASWRRLSAKAAYCRRANRTSRPSAHNQRNESREPVPGASPQPTTNGNGTGGPVPGAWGFRGARPPGLASWRRLSAKAAYCRRANRTSRPSAHNQRNESREPVPGREPSAHNHRTRNRRTGTGCVGVPGGSAPRASIVATPFGEGGLLPASRQNQGRRHGRDAFAPAGQAQAVRGRPGHADRRAAQGLGEHLLRLIAPRRDPRPVPDHLDGDVPYREPRLGEQRGRGPQQRGPRRPRPGGLGRAELRTEVAEASSRQQCVACGVRGHIPIRMAGQPVLTGPEQARQVKRTARRQWVNIGTDADSWRVTGHAKPALTQRCWSGGEDLVEKRLGLVLIRLFGQCELAHQNLAGLR